MEFFLVIGIITGVVWLALVLRWGGLLAGCLLVLLAGCCFGHPFFRIQTGMVPITIDRVLWGILLAYWLWQRGLRSRGSRSWDWTDRLLIGFVVFIALSVGYYRLIDPAARPVVGAPEPLSQLLFFWLMPLGIYLVARDVKLDPTSGGWLLGAMIAFGLYLSLTAVAEVFAAKTLVFPRYIMESEYTEFLGRARGPLLNPIGSGLLSGLGMVAALILGLRQWPRLRWGALLAAATIGIGNVLTLTRSVWLSTAVNTLAIFGWALPRRWRWPAVTFLLALTIVGGWFYRERLVRLKRDRDLTAGAAEDSIALRPLLAASAWLIFKDHPLLGCGFGRYDHVKTPYLADRSHGLPLERTKGLTQHNLFLRFLAELGLVGSLLWLAVLVGWLKRTIDQLRYRQPSWVQQIALLQGAAAVSYLVNGLFHDVALIPMLNMVVFFFAGLRLPGPHEPPSQPAEQHAHKSAAKNSLAQRSHTAELLAAEVGSHNASPQLRPLSELPAAKVGCLNLPAPAVTDAELLAREVRSGKSG